MARTTGIILATGGVTLFNRTILTGKEMDWRVPIATGFAAMGFAILEKGNEKFAVGAAWIALLTVILARIDPSVPSPSENMLKYWRAG